jgi:hypothetical protein
MEHGSMIVFDVEIKRAILGRGEIPIPGIEYCEGFRDFKNMGLAVCCTYDTETHLTRVFLEKQLPELQDYLAAGKCGGFNTRRFDMQLLQAHGVMVDGLAHYDALEQIWLKCGLNPDKFAPRTHGGWGLDAVMLATFNLQKSGAGALAPVWWQQGQRGKVVDYCCRDVWLEAKLITHMLAGGTISAASKPSLTFEPHTFGTRAA